MTDEQRAERLHHHMYETCEGIREHAERIVALEELLVTYIPMIKYSCSRYDCPLFEGCDLTTCYAYDDAIDRMRELGIEVPD